MKMLIMLYLFLSILADQGGWCSRSKESRGPVLRAEPPPRVEFSNSSGAELRCAADGVPPPRVTWHLARGEPARDLPNLRHARSDGSLLFPPFARQDYRQEVHDAVYQCVAANGVGSVLGREVHVRGVLQQRFSPQVFDDFVVRGNTGVLKCHLPSFAREFVSVDAWVRNDDHVLKATDTKARSYTVLRSGELLLHEAQEKDSAWSYRCQTRHRLTGEMVTSASAGKIVVTESHSSTLPRVTFHQVQVRAEEGSSAQLPCVAQGNPPPTYRWVQEVSGGALAGVREEAGVESQGTLHLKKVRLEDAGKYQCIVRNSIGERRIETALLVSAPLSVHVRPAHQVLNIGQEATFNCNVSGHPVHTVTWRKDQRPLAPSARVRLLARDVLHILSVRREDRGMYQCFAANDADSAQGTAELKISDVAPTLLSVFAETTLRPGASASLKCVATGNPAPRVTWTLDDAPLPAGGEAAEEGGHVASVLNVTGARVEDGGEYACRATNDVGSVAHAARLNVHGPPFVRRMSNVTAIAGEDLFIRCPYGGHPIKGIRWLKGDSPLPLNHRQKVGAGGSLTVSSVERAADEGEYRCVVRDEHGGTAAQATHVAVVVAPVIESHFFRESVTVDEMSRTKLMCVVSRGDPPLRFRWLKNALPLLSGGEVQVQTFDDSSIVTFRRVASADRGLYTCVAANAAAAANLTMQLIVNVPPQWTVEPRNASVVLGNTVRMDCAAVGFPAPNILWKKMIFTESTAGDFTYVHSSPRAHRYNNGTLVLSEVEEQDSGSYLCQASNGIGPGLSKIVVLKVRVPPRFPEPFQSKTVTEGSDVSIACSALGDPPIHVEWTKDKAPLSNRYSVLEARLQMLSELHIAQARRDDSGLFACHARSDIGADETVIKLLVQGIPDPPSNLTLTNVTSRSLSLQWEVLDTGNSHLTGSIVQYQTHSDSEWNGQTSQLIVSGAESAATLRGLSPVTTYFVRVVAENALGKSAPSAILETMTDEEAPSGSPTEVHVHSTGAQSMKVMWKAPPEESRHGLIRGYYVGFRASGSEGGAFTFKQVERAPQEQQATYVTGLQPFTEYDIVVRAYNTAGAGPASAQIRGKTLETAPPTSPLVQVLSTTSSTVEFKWEKDAKDKSAITEYSVHYKEAEGGGEWKQRRLTSGQERLEGLRCGTRYLLYMTAFNSLGTGEPSEQVAARTLGAAPMSPPEAAFVQHTNVTSVTLNLGAWLSGGCPISHFAVQFRPKHLSQWTALTDRLAPPLYTLRHLVPDTEYVVMVTAHSEAGLTQAEYLVRTLPALGAAPAFGKRETELPFYKNVALVIPVVVSSLVLLIVVFVVVVCLRKHAEDARIDYENRKDSLMMKDVGKQMTKQPTNPSHYSCPTGNKGDYADPYTCIDSNRQASDGLFATIKRCPTRPVYMPGSYKQGGPSPSQSGHFCRSEGVKHPPDDKWTGGNKR